MTFLDSLPRPKARPEAPPSQARALGSGGATGGDATGPSSAATAVVIPPYGQRLRAKFRPRAETDFGDGGAFPEVHVAQYPLGMGRKATAVRSAGKRVAPAVPGPKDVASSALVVRDAAGGALTTTSTGGVDPLAEDPEARKAAEEANARETALALRKVSSARSKLQGNDPTALRANTSQGEVVKFTPSDDRSATKLVRVVPGQLDPMDPARFKNRKLPARPPSPPAPVLNNTAAAKVSKEDQAKWNVPPAVRGWKNTQGFTVSLDKRVAFNDGRAARGSEANAEKFASLAESLVVAERAAREEVSARAAVRRRQAEREREGHEVRMRELAAKAREERRQGGPGAAPVSSNPLESDETPTKVGAGGSAGAGAGAGVGVDGRSSNSDDGDGDGNGDDGYASSGGYSSTDNSDRRARAERDALRERRKREREQEIRGADGSKRSKTLGDRDVSERIALGAGVGAAGVAGGAGGGAGGGGAGGGFDQRLFGQSGGISSGYGDDETHNPFDKPLFHERTSDILYHRTTGGGEGREAERIVDGLRASGDTANATFAGGDKAGRSGRGPVEFERDEEEAKK